MVKNQDGWGLMRLSRRGNPVISKSISTFEEFLQHYKKNFERHECAIHFRFATHGDVCRDQAHPYEITKGVWIMHNGVIENVPMWDKTKSDTWHFAQMLTDLTEAGWLRESSVEHLLEYAMQGTYSRLVLMDEHGFKIFNEDSGVYWNGVWYSNLGAWDPPQALLDKIYPPKNTTNPTTSVLKELDLSRASDEEYVKFWVNAIDSGAAGIDDAPHDVQQYYRELAETYQQNTSDSGSSQLMLATSVGRQTEYTTYSEVIPEIPQNIQGWAELTRYQIRRICYDSPDAVSDALFDLMQS